MNQGSIDTMIVAAIKTLFDGTIGQKLNDLSARIVTFWNTNAQVADGLLWAQTAAAVVSAVFVFIIAVVAMRRRAIATKPAENGVGPVELPVAAGVMHDRWREIMGGLDSAREGDWKLAVINADTLVDRAMAQAGYAGDTFGDRLMNIEPGSLTSLDGLWWAHKLRNRLAHEADYFLRYTEARQAMAYYEQTLYELKLL